jgi:hypothetical protein
MAKMTAEQALSRIQSIARGVISPEYVASEATTRKRNASKGMKKASGGKVGAKKKMMYGGKAAAKKKK